MIDGWDLTQQALEALLKIVVPAAVAALVVLTRRWVNANVDARKLEQAKEIVKAAVLAAEQNGLAGEIRASGGAKKAQALDAASRWLRAAGINLDVHQLDTLIESLVLEELNRPPMIERPAG